ncbi:Auxin-responsive protein IAA1 [Triticum urartu]|uniref:Auxin-responsive protein n=1 Tax=Triticum urartu TaxID=4572 RepID=M7YWS4_TRIUA|nr:Auxin-responsive protein IAA1 [Triticum urartu]
MSQKSNPDRARVVGWPPVRSFRKNALENVAAGSTRAACAPAKFVKVAVDGAPYLRKVNLRDYAGYDQLLRALQGKFCSHFTIRKFANDEMKLVDAVNGTEYVPTYEDKDGDWMLVGDVPWKMFEEACQRVRLMKNSEAVNIGMRMLGRFRHDFHAPHLSSHAHPELPGEACYGWCCLKGGGGFALPRR